MSKKTIYYLIITLITSFVIFITINQTSKKEIILTNNNDQQKSIIKKTNDLKPNQTTTPQDIEISQEKNKYKKTMTSFFWVGENANTENNNIANHDSAWDDYWVEHYGGVDSLLNRCGYQPCSFTPKENPFYFALPYNDLKINDKRKANSKNIPWYDKEGNKKSILKNKWIEIKYKNKICYAQWEDVGPNNEDDFNFVFKDSQSTNMFGVKAGLDISPSVKDCLSMNDNDFTEWRFLNIEMVPDGPWKNIITTRNVSR